MVIDLCLITDDNYAMPTCITIKSILDNKKESNAYNVYILCKGVSDYKKNKFLELNTTNFSIYNIDINEKEDFSKYKIEGIPATPTSIYKFFIPEILNELDRVIYLDGDIIVQKDLEELFCINLYDNFIGAVKDVNGLFYPEFSNKDYAYFNSGVLLMDLKKLRENGMPNKLLEYRKKGYNKLMDQDTFNYVLKDKVLMLPFKFNTQTNVLSANVSMDKRYKINILKKYWNLQEEQNNIKDIFENAVILHYASAKPWKYYDGYGNDLWLEYYLFSPYGCDRIYRISKYISRIASSTTYKIGKKITYIPMKFKNIGSNKEYKNFLKNFITVKENKFMEK